MPTGDLLRLGVARLTPQQVADMALAEDQARRRALARGDKAEAQEHDTEIRKLLENRYV
jgi:hypothetical protein